MIEKGLPFAVPYSREVYQIDRMQPTRGLEAEMLSQGDRYDSARLGAEIAYVVATEKLGLNEVVMHEPSSGGNDLETSERTAIIQARLLTSTKDPSQDMQAKLKADLGQMAKKVHDGFRLYPRAAVYAILTYIDLDRTARAVVVTVRH